MEVVVDLHTHTSYSDGSLSPGELIDRAAAAGVGYLSITDHDSVAAYADPATQIAADRAGIELVPGIEISASTGTHRMHILGLFVETTASVLEELNRKQYDARQRYTADVSELFRRDGWSVDTETLMSEGVVTKAHIADNILTDARNLVKLERSFGVIPKRGEFIEFFMNEGGRYYTERDYTKPDEAIRAIHTAGGIAILAHPVATLFEGGDISIIRSTLEEYDFDGLEAFYYYFSKSRGDTRINQVGRFTELADKMGLVVSGGSDYHGPQPSVGKHVEVGFKNESHRPHIEMFERLRQRRDQRQTT